MEYEQLQLTITDSRRLFRELIAAWAGEEAPEGDGYYGLPRIPVFKFVTPGGEEMYFGLHPRDHLPQSFPTSEAALAYSMFAALGRAVLEIAGYVKDRP